MRHLTLSPRHRATVQRHTVPLNFCMSAGFPMPGLLFVKYFSYRVISSSCVPVVISFIILKMLIILLNSRIWLLSWKVNCQFCFEGEHLSYGHFKYFPLCVAFMGLDILCLDVLLASTQVDLYSISWLSQSSKFVIMVGWMLRKPPDLQPSWEEAWVASAPPWYLLFQWPLSCGTEPPVDLNWLAHSWVSESANQNHVFVHLVTIYIHCKMLFSPLPKVYFYFVQPNFAIGRCQTWSKVDTLISFSKVFLY